MTRNAIADLGVHTIDVGRFREQLRRLSERTPYSFPAASVPRHFRQAAVLLPFWENGGDTIDDQAWVEQVVDLPTAVGESRVQIQWTYGSTDGSWNYCGWNIDDVVIEGAMPCDSLSMVFSDDFETGDCESWAMAVGER